MSISDPDDRTTGPGSRSEGRPAGEDEELLRLLAEADAHFERVRAEVTRRMGERAARESEVAQHAEVSRLAEYLERAQVDWRQVLAFIQSAFVEAQRAEPWGRPPDAGGGPAPDTR